MHLYGEDQLGDRYFPSARWVISDKTIIWKARVIKKSKWFESSLSLFYTEDQLCIILFLRQDEAVISDKLIMWEDRVIKKSKWFETL